MPELETFQPLVGDAFGLGLTLVAAESLGAAPSPELRAPFRLEFRGPDGLAQQIHRLEHASLGAVEVFLVPIGPGAYEAVFA